MRLTTKIVLGAILSIFIGAIVFIVALSFTDRKSFENDWLKLGQKNISSIDVAPYHTIKIELEGGASNRNIDFSTLPRGGVVFRQPTSGGQKNKLFLPDELKKFTKVKVDSDTLFIVIDSKKIKSTYSGKTESGIDGVNYLIYADNVDFINLVPTMKTEINGLHAQLIRVNSEGDVKVESCIVDKLESASGNLNLKNNKLKQLNLDLDKIYNWKVENCQIEEENLSGGNTHYIKTPRSETKALNWHPKNKDARLNIELSADSARLVFK